MIRRECSICVSLCAKPHPFPLYMMAVHLSGALCISSLTNTTPSVCCPTMLPPCCQRHADVVQLLLAHKDVDINRARALGGETPLFIACYMGHLQIVDALLVSKTRQLSQQGTPPRRARHRAPSPRQ
jgi:hypothetical protein